LLQTFLQQQTGTNGRTSFSDTSILDTTVSQQPLDKFLIVETNFKIIGYTSSLLYRALLKLFVRVEYIFPNLIVGTLTRKSLQRAFQRGITSDQILHFLESHTHTTARLNKLV